MTPVTTRVELAALLAVGQDHAFGQPPGAQLRATALADQLARAAGAGADERATTWWVSALRFLGCTGHAFEVAAMFGDEIALRDRSLRVDAANPGDMLRLMVGHAGPGRAGLSRLRSVVTTVAGAPTSVAYNFRTACEVADALAARFGLDLAARAGLATSFERWNGRGVPNGIAGTGIPRPMRVAQLAQEFEVLARLDGYRPAIATIGARRGGAYDPELADLLVAHAASWWAEIEDADPWDAALAAAPVDVPLDADGVHDALLVIADFADLKSPWTAGHSRAVAALAGEAGGPAAEAAGLLHDLGRVAVPNTVWDKPGPLTRDERDRAETVPLHTEQILRRTRYTAELAATAGAAHERMDGSGYHRRVGGAGLDAAQRALAAADCYQAMTSERPHRAPHRPAAAAAEMRALAGTGRLCGVAVERVLAAAGHRPAVRASLPAGLTTREVEVLRLLAVGSTTRAVAERLVISPKTADHHIQHIYAKIGVSTRGAAALFATENGLLPTRN
ncbi:LuxR C-terminal-related transcriptional regulator [Actinomycetospora endophytica]|uniref:LuxR C-terminal-related transcriptional regulator n=1 Tax=Actinomycetospora endophytica TaxID=2291215 RepID=A0ABS8P173_9PSEU|nr:HD domain-containing phosphohydrolase [Actinomycetospora endophytica]MCD2192012.1 LuxR C-terminal-related transcriptional regulator [Actinomycetospora endophytica]